MLARLPGRHRAADWQVRQLVGQYITGKRGHGGFPGPVCGITDGHSLWRWCEVSYWLWENAFIKKEMLDESRITAINAILEWHRQRLCEPLLAEELEALTGALEPAD